MDHLEAFLLDTDDFGLLVGLFSIFNVFPVNLVGFDHFWVPWLDGV